MKKLLLVIAVCLMALVITACSSDSGPKDPIVAKWAMLFNDGQSKLLFSFEEIGDLDVVVWHTGASGDLEQAEDYAGSYTDDKENCVITYDLNGKSYELTYSLVENESLTLTYGEKTITLDYAMSN